MDTSNDSNTWADMCARDHFVQFYDEDQTIVEAVAGYFSFGMRFKEGCLLVGTEQHNEAILGCMRELGCNVDEAISVGRFIVIGAEETLAKFMRGGMPDQELFESVVGGVVANVTIRDKPPRVFGEMVAVLSEHGNTAAAIALEKLWNDLAKRTQFRLFCAYKHQVVNQSGASGFTREICSTHSHVIGLAAA